MSMVHIKGGYLADVVPHSVHGIKARIERNAQEQFIIRSVPELFFLHLGLEYFSDEKITLEVLNNG